ncbi:MAG: methyltransferase [Cyclobacteriaceae bacterium]
MISKEKSRRFQKTIEFVKKTLPAKSSILDLGTSNALSKLLSIEGYIVSNTSGEDLDNNIDFITSIDADCTTAFEIFEHLLNPLGVLKAIKSESLIASIPLRLWFAKAYRNKTDRWDQHFHEFEDWQFDWLLEKAGWEIVKREKWTSPTKINGIRPILRLFTPRYYIVEARRKK